MTRSLLGRRAAAVLAATTLLTMTGGPVAAAADDGPYVFDSSGSGQALTVAVGLPSALADGLAPALEQVPGVTLEDGALTIRLANVLADLELPLDAGAPGQVTALADATSLTGSLSGLVEQVAGGVACLDTPLDVTIPPDADVPLVSMRLLQAECTADEAGRRSIAASQIADLEVNLAGALALLPAEASEQVTATLDEVVDQVTQDVLDPLTDQVLTPVQDALNENLGTNVDLSEAVRVPELFDLPLVSIDLIESTTRTLTDGDVIRSISSASLAGVSLLGTVCLPDTTYTSEAFATGEPGGNGYETSIPTIDVAVCETATLSPILRLLEQDGIVGDVLVNLGDGELRPLAELLDGSDVPLQDVLDGLDGLLATLGVSTLVQGQQANAAASEDGRDASAGVTPFSIGVAPLGDALAGTPLDGLDVTIAGLGVDAAVAAAPAPAEEPAAAPTPALPRTGGGALAGLLGALALGGAVALRRRT